MLQNHTAGQRNVTRDPGSSEHTAQKKTVWHKRDDWTCKFSTSKYDSLYVYRWRVWVSVFHDFSQGTLHQSQQEQGKKLKPSESGATRTILPSGKQTRSVVSNPFFLLLIKLLAPGYFVDRSGYIFSRLFPVKIRDIFVWYFRNNFIQFFLYHLCIYF